jgi:hypothetical protein
MEPISSIWNGVRHLVALIHRSVARLAVISQGSFGKIAAGFVASIWERCKQTTSEKNSKPAKQNLSMS